MPVGSPLDESAASVGDKGNRSLAFLCIEWVLGGLELAGPEKAEKAEGRNGGKEEASGPPGNLSFTRIPNDLCCPAAVEERRGRGREKENSCQARERLGQNRLRFYPTYVGTASALYVLEEGTAAVLVLYLQEMYVLYLQLAEEVVRVFLSHTAVVEIEAQRKVFFLHFEKGVLCRERMNDNRNDMPLETAPVSLFGNTCVQS
ncbi:hypothetical protein BU61_2032 [Pontoporia blainvillei]|uniref:Uncharacterized protein n=1 Tax=Pontoporia blainvillei TaxID=48723 RepID=A0ABX0S6H3_PONBL|nr:hypothetical protein [Pontoporia blainvillei]